MQAAAHTGGATAVHLEQFVKGYCVQWEWCNFLYVQ